MLLTTLYKVSNIIYHDLQKQFVTDVVNEILNNIVNEPSHSSKNQTELSSNRGTIINLQLYDSLIVNFFTFYV